VRKGDRLEDLDINGKMALNETFKNVIGWESTEYAIAEDRDRWRALVGVVMNFGLHKMRGIS
jgi:hypothetical protein